MTTAEVVSSPPRPLVVRSGQGGGRTCRRPLPCAYRPSPRARRACFAMRRRSISIARSTSWLTPDTVLPSSRPVLSSTAPVGCWDNCAGGVLQITCRWLSATRRTPSDGSSVGRSLRTFRDRRRRVRGVDLSRRQRLLAPSEAQRVGGGGRGVLTGPQVAWSSCPAAEDDTRLSVTTGLTPEQESRRIATWHAQDEVRRGVTP